MFESNRHPVWLLFCLLISSAYLICEFIFNALLVDAAGSREFNEYYKDIEVYGRLVSSFGIALLLANFIKSETVLKNFIIFIPVVVFTVPTSYMAQHWFFETYMVNQTNAEQRQQASMSQWVTNALKSQTLKIEGVPESGSEEPTVRERTFLTLFGGLVYFDELLLSDLESQKKELVEQYVRQKAYENFDEYYNEYQLIRAEVKEQFDLYQNKASSYYSALDGIEDRIQIEHGKLNSEIEKGFQDYLEAKNKFISEYKSVGEEYAPALYKILENVFGTGCRTKFCRKSNIAAYQTKVRGTIFEGIPLDYWLSERAVGFWENFAGSAILGAATGGYYWAAQGIDKATGGSGFWQDKKLYYINEPSHYVDRILSHPAVLQEFEVNSGGYSIDIENLDQFMESPITSRFVTNELRNKGVYVPKNWSITDRNEFDIAMAKKIQKSVKQRWMKEAKEAGFDLEPTLTWNEFQSTDLVQSKIISSLPEGIELKKVLATWNNVTFKKNVIEPTIENKVNEVLSVLKANTDEFSDGGKYEDQGKKIFLGVIIPPIAMGLSLFLSLLTALNVIGMLYMLLTFYKVRDPIASSLKMISMKFAVIAIILIIPVHFMNEETKQDSAIQYFAKGISESTNNTVGKGLNWIMNTQPVVYPVGRFLEDRFQIYKKFVDLRS